MSKLRPLNCKEVLRVLRKIGFSEKRQKGSHISLFHPDGRHIVIPCHPGKDIGKGLLRKIIKEANLSVEEFFDLLKDG